MSKMAKMKLIVIGVSCGIANLGWDLASPASHRWWVMLVVAIAGAAWIIAHDAATAD